MNPKRILLTLGLLLALAPALPLHAQTGCDDSPENPTVVLMAVGGIGYLARNAWTRRNGRKP